VTKQRDQQLEVGVVDGRLVISIGVDLLVHAVTHSDDWPEDGQVVDPDKFAAAIARQLEDEQEDGTTPLHLAFDAAAVKAIEDGDESVRLAGDDE